MPTNSKPSTNPNPSQVQSKDWKQVRGRPRKVIKDKRDVTFY
jgi:hypothetical protein